MRHHHRLLRNICGPAVVAALALAACTNAETAKVTVDATAPGTPVSPTLYGIFFEEINRAGDGGLYAELIQNRSFEDGTAVPLAWDFITAAGNDASWALDRSSPLNVNNPTSLRLDVRAVKQGGRVAIANGGFIGCPRNGGESDAAYAERFAAAVEQQRGHGIAVRARAEYVLSIDTRAAAATGPALTVSLEKRDGTVLASAILRPAANTWSKHQVTLKASADADDARLVIAVTEPGTIYLDMVSLFPKDTFKGHANGLRKDLAEMVAAMHPKFMRFPGGCFVEGDEIENATRWKRTIGDVAERPGHWNLWGYRSTDGLGFHEYLQFCEDIGAEPLFVINVGMSHHRGQLNAYAVPMDQMGAYVQDVVDAIEYCNGGPETKWGALRAAAGHPAPFNLKYIEVGNENGGPAYNERFSLFHDAIKKKDPHVNVVANVWGGTPHSRPFELKDEHYYESPSWFMANADRYDSYDRSGPRVYVGEYAVTKGCGLGNLAAAIGEAAFMTGIERNGDVVAMASYAPLFAEPAWKRWNPNAINFDGRRVYGTPSYHVQAMFGANRADVVFPVNVDAPALAEVNPRGRFGIGTWDTQAEFKDIRVTTPDGKTLWAFDPAKGTDQFQITGGQWQIADGALRQTSAERPANAFAGDAAWGDYTVHLKARKTGGSEGFLVSFHSTDPATTSWWNVGGWQNREHGLEAPDIPQTRRRGSIEADRWYDVRLELRGRSVKCYLDGKLVQEASASNYNRLFATAGIDRAAGEVVLKVVNSSDVDLRTTFDLKGVTGVDAAGRAIVLTSASNGDENSMDEPTRVVPHESTFIAGQTFEYTIPARSVTVLRMKAAAK